MYCIKVNQSEQLVIYETHKDDVLTMLKTYSEISNEVKIMRNMTESLEKKSDRGAAFFHL